MMHITNNRNMTIRPPSASIKPDMTRGYGINTTSRIMPPQTFGPDGRRIRPNKPQLARQGGERVEMGSYDYHNASGKMMQQNIQNKNRRPKGMVYDHARGIRQDASLVLPIRQTASIFKQPVTVVRNHSDSKTKADLKHGPQDTQPRQLFWEKGLQGLKACDSSEEVMECLELPTVIRGVGPNMSTENVIQSIAAALHLTNQPIVGQSAGRVAGHKNLGVTLDTNQPHMEHAVVSEDDIKSQESRVNEMRERLTQAFKSIE